MNVELIKQAIALLQQAISEPTPEPGPVLAPITSIEFENLGGAQKGVPFTFGQVFAVGHLQPGTGLHGRLDNGDEVPLQLDEKARHADGSVRHAIVSGILPTLFASEKRKMALVPGLRPPEEGIKNFVTSRVAVTIEGVLYEAFNRDDFDRVWMSGPVVTEFSWSAPLMNAKGEAHPHLHARFATRCYIGERTRIDVTVENDWAYEPGPQNFIYDLLLEVEGKKVFEQKALTHYHHARWRKVFWAGEAPNVHIRHDPRYLIDTRALPNYDTSIQVLDAKPNAADGTAFEMMSVGAAMRAMPTTGGRGDIGLLPSWAAAWLLNQGPNSAAVTLGTADLAGSWSMHYRDKDTDKPISLIDYPYMTLLGNSGDTLNPATKKREAFPGGLKGLTDTPNKHDVSHQPNLAYLPYLMTGDLYYLEELQFWAMYNVFSSNPGYRENRKGLVHRDQVRGQAWALRTLAEAAYITPDDDRLKSNFTEIVDNNLAWYNAEYTDNPDANKLGLNATNYAVIYNGKLGVGPWQDDFFTQAIGHVAELGFAEAERLLRWKTKFVIERMIGKGACYVFAASYSLNVRATVGGPIFDNIADVYRATIPAEQLALACGDAALAKALKLQPGEMTGYSKIGTGYPSNMQPALAYAADVSEDGKRAWKLFMSRSVKPDYSTSPQFAIVPR